MAKFIFNKNSENQIGQLCHIAQDQDFINANKNFNEINYNIVDVTIEEFNDVKNGKKEVVSYMGSTVTFKTKGEVDELGTPPNAPENVFFFNTEEELKKYINILLEKFEFYLRFNSEKPLKGLDTSNLTPLNISLEQYASEQGQDPVHLLELI